MAIQILQGSVFDVLPTLPADWFHCCVTSPPYWALRSYLKPGDPLKVHELGSEPTPEAHVAAMVRVFDEVRRVLRPDGLLWVNYGDSYASQPSGSFDKGGRGAGALQGGEFKANKPFSSVVGNLKPLDKCGIPERFALAMQADGWWWRDTIIWHKKSPMPQSVSGTRWERCRVRINGFQEKRYGGKGEDPQSATERLKMNVATARANGVDHERGAVSLGWQDCPGCPRCRDNGGYVLRRGSWRTTTAHEVIFMFAKSADYFADQEGVKEKCADSTMEREKYTRVLDDPDEQFAVRHDHESISGGKRNPRSVMHFKQEPLKAAHYAAYPTGLPAWCIKASTSPKGVCAECGAPWARVVGEKTITNIRGNSMKASADGQGVDESVGWDKEPSAVVSQETLGFRPTCQCIREYEHAIPASPRVLDPFGGSGSTAIAAAKLGCDCTLVELNPEYIKIARKRLAESVGLFAADNS